jgi:glycosyltransferase involved in cell wall biosynthesis
VNGYHEAIARAAAAHPNAIIIIIAAELGQSLGARRNLAVHHAIGDWICQWDDDDRYHPHRLTLLWQAAQIAHAAVNYLVDQLHGFTAEQTLYWDDWQREPCPSNLIQGTLLARRDIMPLYPDQPRVEGIAHTSALLRADAATGFGISRLRDAGWCYL